MVTRQAEREVAARELVERAEARRVAALASLEARDRASLGQFFTPERAAGLLASMAELPARGTLRLLDPGAGTGALSAAVVARVLREAPKLALELVVVEVDPNMTRHLEEGLDDIRGTCAAHGVAFSADLLVGDFIDLCTNPFDPPPALDQGFDLVPMNPPYKKLHASDPARRVMSARGVDCPNIYAAFMALALELLKPGGQLVSITPRSFANGSYFDAFRRHMLERMAIKRLHVFDSRSTVFGDTGVLQENVILAGVRHGTRDEVSLSVSVGHNDEPETRVVPHDEVVRPDDPHRFVRILSRDSDTEIAVRMAAQPCTLTQLGLAVSTGRVVDFRSRPCLVAAETDGSVPLVYPGNLRGGEVDWPRGLRKAQGFAPRTPQDKKLLLPTGNYVLVKRFSAKEERRRIVAGVWLGSQSPKLVAFENHINYFHENNAGFDESLAVGLSYWLNSSLVDAYFRTFSGHTQVNATDLRSLRYPSRATLMAIGTGRTSLLPPQKEIDELVADALAATAAAA